MSALSTLPCFPTGGLLTCVRPPKKKISKVWSLQYKLVTISTISTSKFCMLIFRLSRCRLVFIIHHFVRINWLIIIIFLVNTKKYQHCTVPIQFLSRILTAVLHRCWWRMLETKCVDDNFDLLITDILHWESHQYFLCAKHYDSVTTIKSPTNRCHQHHSRRIKHTWKWTFRS